MRQSATKEQGMTVTKELFEAWQRLRRHGDSKKLSQILGKSQPTIDLALNKGRASDNNVVEGITNFYQERKKAELKQANELSKD